MNELAIKPMSYDEARECADQINANMTNIRTLVLDLYERKGWVALGYKSWRDCVVKEFDQSQSYLYQQLGAAQTARNISAIAENSDKIPESQLRSLAKLKDNPEQQREVWQQAVTTAPDGKITASHVSKTVKGMMIPEQTKPSPPPQPQILSDAILSARMAIELLQLIESDDPMRKEALREVKLWIKKKTTGLTPKKKTKKCKIPNIRHKQIGDWFEKQIPLGLPPAG